MDSETMPNTQYKYKVGQEVVIKNGRLKGRKGTVRRLTLMHMGDPNSTDWVLAYDLKVMDIVRPLWQLIGVREDDLTCGDCESSR